MFDCRSAEQRTLKWGQKGKIRFWNKNYKDNNYAGEIMGHTTSVNVITALNSSQKSIISAAFNRNFRVWKLEEEFLKKVVKIYKNKNKHNL